MIEQHDTEAYQKMANTVSDEAGRFAGGNPTIKGLRTYGERHNIRLERRKRQIRQLAESVNRLVRGEKDCSDWCLAASREINQKLVKELDADIKSRMRVNLSEDLAKFDESGLVNFCFGKS